ncbi:MAG: cbb3-type cytochrome c oxidase subunit 3 [Acidobacteriota bacterium]|nr:cbb3-type cytochrome c oxidase subunit 3 [Acidobacteriota bacterium]
MLKNVISQGDWVLWPQLALGVFTLTFIAVVIWTARRKATDHYETMARMALEDTREQHHD